MVQLTRMLILQALLALSAHQTASAFNVNVLNRCEKDLVLAQVSPNGVSTTTLSPGGTATRSVSGASVVFKSGTGAQATRTLIVPRHANAWRRVVQVDSLVCFDTM